MKKAKLQNGLIEIIDYEKEKNILSQEELCKYKNFISSDCPSFNEDLEILTVSYIESENEIIEKWNVQIDVSKVNKKIKKLKDSLASTDFIIIKAYEAKLSMSDAPYSQEQLEKITQERQALRDRINELEELIK